MFIQRLFRPDSEERNDGRNAHGFSRSFHGIRLKLAYRVEVANAMANFSDMLHFFKSEDPHIAKCGQARSKMIGTYLDSHAGLSKERRDFFQALASENQKPYCDGSQTMGPVTDSSPVILTQEKLNQLLKLPITDR